MTRSLSEVLSDDEIDKIKKNAIESAEAGNVPPGTFRASAGI